MQYDASLRERQPILIYGVPPGELGLQYRVPRLVMRGELAYDTVDSYEHR